MALRAGLHIHLVHHAAADAVMIGFWVRAPLDTNTEELEQLFDEYGFEVEHFDGLDGEHAHVEDVDA